MNLLVIICVVLLNLRRAQGEAFYTSDEDVQTIISDVTSAGDSFVSSPKKHDTGTLQRENIDQDKLSVITGILRQQEMRMKKLEKKARYSKTLESIVKQLHKRVTELEHRDIYVIKLKEVVERQEKQILDLQELYSENLKKESKIKSEKIFSEPTSNFNIYTGNHDTALSNGDKRKSNLSSEDKGKQISVSGLIKEKNGIKESEHNHSRKVRLLLPSTPPSTNGDVVAFYAYLSHTTTPPGQKHTLIFDTEVTDSRNAYHDSTGVFIAPKDGFYVFSWSMRLYKGNHGTEIVVNKAVMGSLYTRQTTDEDDQTGSQTVVVHVNQGDDVFIRTHSTHPGTGALISDTNGRCSFAGFMIA